MSFSAGVKKELAGTVPAARHCQIAELAAFVRMLSAQERADDGLLRFQTENEWAVRKLFTLSRRAFKMNIAFSETLSKSGNRTIWTGTVPDAESGQMLLAATSHSSVLRMECCRKAFLRGAFLSAGSISAPEKYYHLEFVSRDPETAEMIRGTMRSLELDARIVRRKGDFVVYLKESDQILALLGAMGASISFLNIENIRVLKEMRGSVNRRVNCETANLNKTVVSAVRQMEDIRYIRDSGGFGELTPQLREMAEIRLAYPEASLAELGEHLSPRIGKSGVNHRLRRLSAFAENLRMRRSENQTSGPGFIDEGKFQGGKDYDKEGDYDST